MKFISFLLYFISIYGFFNLSYAQNINDEQCALEFQEYCSEDIQVDDDYQRALDVTNCYKKELSRFTDKCQKNISFLYKFERREHRFPFKKMMGKHMNHHGNHMKLPFPGIPFSCLKDIAKSESELDTIDKILEFIITSGQASEKCTESFIISPVMQCLFDMKSLCSDKLTPLEIVPCMFKQKDDISDKCVNAFKAHTESHKFHLKTNYVVDPIMYNDESAYNAINQDYQDVDEAIKAYIKTCEHPDCFPRMPYHHPHHKKFRSFIKFIKSPAGIAAFAGAGLIFVVFTIFLIRKFCHSKPNNLPNDNTNVIINSDGTFSNYEPPILNHYDVQSDFMNTRVESTDFGIRPSYSYTAMRN